MGVTNPAILGIDPTVADTAAQFPLGFRARVGKVEYVYCKATAVKTAYLAFVIDKDHLAGNALTTTVAASTPQRFGVPQVTLSGTSAAPVYGWFAIKGHGITVALDSGAATTGQVLTGANAGSLTTLGTGSLIEGAVVETTATAATNGIIDAFEDLAVN